MSRLRLREKFTLALATVSALSIALALIFQHHSLGAGLEEAAQRRLTRAGDAVERLLANQVVTTRERYVAISGTPQFRANLEVDDPPTLGHYAAELMRAQSAETVVFLDRGERVVAAAGRQDLARHRAIEGLIESGGHAYLCVDVPLASGGWSVGRLVAVERLPDRLLQDWGELVGVQVDFANASEPLPGELTASVRHVGGLDLRVSTSLEFERKALAHSRSRLAIAALIGLGAAVLGGALLSRSLVSPILEVQRTTETLGDGDFDARLDAGRSDELGDMARAINRMAERLEQHSVDQRAHAAHLARINGELRRAKAVAELAGRTRSEFLTNLSHEVRTPMAAVMGYVDLLLEEDLSEAERAEFGAAIRKNGEQLLELIQRMLEAASEDTEGTPIERTPCRPRALIADAMASVRADAAAKNLELGARVDESVPEVVRAGAGPLLEVLRSLLDNAVRFTERGTISVDAHCVGAQLCIDVTDTGIGIHARDLERVFEPFVQADGSTTREVDGAGLGLTVARRLARELGGDLTVVSTPGRGSTFSLSVEIDAAEEARS